MSERLKLTEGRAIIRRANRRNAKQSQPRNDLTADPESYAWSRGIQKGNIKVVMSMKSTTRRGRKRDE
jgi:hypothetical protein